MILYRNQRWKIFPRPLPILANGHFWTEIWTFDQFRSKSPYLESLEIFSEKKFETSQNFKLKKISSRSQNQIHTVLSFFSIRFLVYWISLPQKRVYWWTVLGSVKFYLQICLQFLFWCQIRGHIKSALSLLFFSPSDCVRLLFVLSVPFSIANQGCSILQSLGSVVKFVPLHRKSIALHHHVIWKINRQDLDEGPQSNKDNINIQQMLNIRI